MKANRNIKIGIWGMAGAGKTVFMLMLYHYLTTDHNSKWRVIVPDDITASFIDENLSLLVNQGHFPDPTPIAEDDEVKKYTFILIPKNKNGLYESIELGFYDLPGHFSINLEKPFKIDKEEKTLADYFVDCDGLLLLISPLKQDYCDTINENGKKITYFELLGQLFKLIQRKRKVIDTLDQYVALCITKADHPDIYERSISFTPEEMLLSLLGDSVSLSWLDNFLKVDIASKTNTLKIDPSKDNRCQVFYVSPFGVYQDGGKMRSPVKITRNNDNERKKPRYSDDYPIEITSPKVLNHEGKFDNLKFNPINMISPLSWILEGIKIANFSSNSQYLNPKKDI